MLMNRSEYATLNMLAITARIGSTGRSPRSSVIVSASAKNISLLMNPFSSGTPAMAAAATIASVAVNGMCRHRPFRMRMSRVPVS